jgi:hypothetical protein
MDEKALVQAKALYIFYFQSGTLLGTLSFNTTFVLGYGNGMRISIKHGALHCRPFLAMSGKKRCRRRRWRMGFSGTRRRYTCMCMHVYACVCNLLTFLLLPYLFFNAVTIIRTRSREESGRLSR